MKTSCLGMIALLFIIPFSALGQSLLQRQQMKQYPASASHYSGMMPHNRGAAEGPTVNSRKRMMRRELLAQSGVFPSARPMADGPSPAWTRHYINPTEPSNGEFQSVVVDNEGNIYAGGYSEESFPRNRVALLAKYDRVGTRRWTVRERSNYYWWNGFQTLAVDSAVNIYALDPYQRIIKFNAEGVKQWSIDTVGAFLMAVDHEGNIYAAEAVCISSNCDETEIVTIKYNTDGVLQWTMRFSMVPTSINYCNDISVDASGHPVITGSNWEPGSGTPATFTVKYNADGTEAWRVTYHGPYGWHVASGDSGFVYVSASSDGGNQNFTIKYDSAGAQRWVSATQGYSRGIAPDGDGNVIVATIGIGDMWNIVKYNPNGSMKWSRSFSRPNSDLRGLTVDNGGNSFVTGSYDSAGYPHLTITSLDANGSTRYDLSYPDCGMSSSDGSGPYLAISAAADSNSNTYVIGGAEHGFDGFHKGLLLSLSYAGIQQWLASYDSPRVPMDRAADMDIDAAGNVYVCGTKPMIGGSSMGFFVLNYSPNGDFLWKYTGDSTSSNGDEHGPELHVARDGSAFILHGISGDTSKSLSLTALNSSGNRQWSNLSIEPGSTWWRQQEALLMDDAENLFVVACTKAPWDAGYDGTMGVAAYANSGRSLWSVRVQGRSPLSAALDTKGELSILTIASSFYGTGIYSPSVYRFDKSGNVRWVFQLDSLNAGAWLGLTAGDRGCVWISGGLYVSQRIYFRTIKLNELGVCQWVKDYDEGNGFDQSPGGIAVDKNGNVVVVGFPTCCYGGIKGTMVSYDALGNQRWVSKTPVDAWGVSEMIIDGAGDILVGYGGFRFAKYSPNGDVLWSAAYSNPDWAGANSVAHIATEAQARRSAGNLVPHRGFGGSEVALAADGNGHLYVTGSFGDYWSGLDGPGSVLSSAITTLCYHVPSTEVHDIAGPTPAEFRLSQNYPNPFNPTTTIEYNIGEVVALGGAHFSGVEGRAYTNVRLVVFDILGREVATLVNEVKQPGTYTVQWDASRQASGVYFYQLRAGSFVDMKRLVLLK